MLELQMQVWEWELEQGWGLGPEALLQLGHSRCLTEVWLVTYVI